MDQEKILESWKEIAAHLGRNVRTCQMWERARGLPIHRLAESPKARVFAYPEELDRWLARKLENGTGDPGRADPSRRAVLPTLPGWRGWHVASLVVLAAAAVAASAWLLGRQDKVRWANDLAIPEIQRLLLAPGKDEAYDLALRVEKIVPSSPQLARLMPLVSGRLTIETEPAGAEVSVRPYGKLDAPWRSLGRTPVKDRRLSLGPKQWRVVRSGWAPAEGSANIAPGESCRLGLKLDKTGQAPSGMVRVPGQACGLPQFQVSSSPPLLLDDFWIDRYEVTNRDYLAFVEAGGYSDRRYWKHPVRQDGRVLGWEEAMALFVDRTGRPGPSTWVSGTCPIGREDEPVTGVSWFEASAYAEFAGKRLPSAYHWCLAAGVERDTDCVIPLSNFDGRGLAPVGAYAGIGCFGTYDMAGNAKEWCSNEAGGKMVSLGGAWNEAQYWAFLFDHYPAFMRAANFGFRCMKDIRTAGDAERAHAPLAFRTEPDYAAMTPCPDAVFEAYRSLYDYSPADLEGRVESRREWSPDTVLEKVSFLAADGIDRVIAYLFLPRNARPPFQSVVYVPGSSVMSLDSIFDYATVKTREVELYTRSGRAVVFPVFWNTLERRQASLPPRNRQFLRERMIRHHRELARTLDYLQTRPDFDLDRIAYQGLSWGAYAGPIHVALEKRFRAANFVSGGFYWEMHTPGRGAPEWDAVNFAPRVKVPVLMQNGLFDAFYPFETNSSLLFRMFGTPEADKHLAIYPTGHSVWLLNESRRDIFEFLDTYLGKPAR